MWLILLCMLLGVGAGYRLRRRAGLIRGADRAAALAVYWLLFLLGLSVGGNGVVMGALARLGGQALLLSAGAIGGSILLLLVTARRWGITAVSHEE